MVKNRSSSLNNKSIEDMPEPLKNRIKLAKATDVKLVIEKKLSNHEVDKENGRFLMPKYLIVSDFLTEAEKYRLGVLGKDLDCLLLDPSLKNNITVALKKWKKTKTGSYALTINWCCVVKRNDDVLKEGVKVRLWSYRLNSDLYFALSVVEQDERESSCASNDPGLSTTALANFESELNLPPRKRKERVEASNCSLMPPDSGPLAATTGPNPMPTMPASPPPTLLMAGYLAYQYLAKRNKL